MIIRPFWILCAAAGVAGFHLPGGAPKDYARGDAVELLVNALDAQAGQGTSSLFSYDYLDPRFSFIRPEVIQRQSEPIGSILFGDRLYNSPFQINMLSNVTCKVLGTTEIISDSADFIGDRIHEMYALNFLVDGLPSSERIPLGQESTKNTASTELNNHYRIFLEYHSNDGGLKNRVVGVAVYPISLDSLAGNRATTSCTTTSPLILKPHTATKVAYTYDVVWRASTLPYASRWDAYLKILNPSIHLLSLLNSFFTVLFLVFLCFSILLKSVNRDITKYAAIDLGEDAQEDSAWRKIYGEVFRPPRKRNLLAALIGSGCQLGVMMSTTLFFAILGFLSPSNRGSLATMVVVAWMLCGSVAGYISSRVYASLRGEEWTKNVAFTSLLFPSFLFGIISLLNFLLIGAGASGALPFGTILATLLLFLFVNIPLTLLGSWIGAKKGAISHPNRVNAIPRQIPPCPWYLQTLPSALIAGLLPFGAAFIESYYILQSFVGARAYIAFGFLALTFCIVVLTTATVTILMCYFHLSVEEYRWHWRAFVTGGGSAFWLFLYGLVYLTRLHLQGFANVLLYLGYLILLSSLSAVLTGAIGFLSTYAFLRIIYSRIRVD